MSERTATRSDEAARSHPSAASFLVTSAHEVASRGWVFTGFNWPVLAARLARRLDLAPFIQVLEGGAALDRDTPRLLTSTTDYAAFGDAMCYRGGLGDVLLSVVGRCDRVVIDGANVDLAGRTNSTAIGPLSRPKVRMPGGGGGPDAAGRARELVLLHGGTDPRRLQSAVEHVTASPGPDTTIRLVTRWATIRLGERPSVETIVEHPATAGVLASWEQLGVQLDSARPARAPTAAELAGAEAVLAEAAAAGYQAGVAGLEELRTARV